MSVTPALFLRIKSDRKRLENVIGSDPKIEIIDKFLDTFSGKKIPSNQKDFVEKLREFLKPLDKASIGCQFMAGYLPQMLTMQEVETIAIRQSTLGLSFNGVMHHLHSHYDGRFDKKSIEELVREIV